MKRREFSFSVKGTTICFVQMYGDCWICSLPGIVAERLELKVSEAASIPIGQLEVTTRTANILRAEGFVTVHDVIQRSENDMLKLVNFGATSLKDLKTCLASIGFALRDE